MIINVLKSSTGIYKMISHFAEKVEKTAILNPKPIPRMNITKFTKG